MSSRSYVVGFVCGVLAIAAAAGCATQRNQIKPAAMQPAGASGLASIAGAWEGGSGLYLASSAPRPVPTATCTSL